MNEVDQNELRTKLAESVARAVKKYLKAGGEYPDRGESAFTYVDKESMGWSLEVTGGHAETDEIFI